MEVLTNQLAKACGKVARIKSNKDYPISDYLLLKFCKDTNSLVMRATDNYVFCECEIPCEGEVEDLSFIVEAGKFIKLISKTTKDKVKFAPKGDALQVRGNGSYTLEVLDEDFLDVPELDDADVYTISLKELKPALLDAIKCKSNMSNMPLASGVCINDDSVWGTDMSVFIAHDFKTNIDKRVVIADNLCTLIPCLNEGDATMYINEESGSCIIRDNDTLIYGSIVGDCDGYPDLSTLFSVEDKSIITVNKAEVLQAIDRLSIFTDATDSNISIAVIENGLGLTVGGKSVEQITVKTSYEVVPTTLTVSMAMLKHVIQIMQNDFIELQYTKDELCGALFICDGIVSAGMSIME